MRPGKPSATSTYVAFLRALAAVGVTGLRAYEDPVTRRLLPRPLRWLVGRAERTSPRVRDLIWQATLGAIDLVPLRTLALDDAWHAARQAGVRQLVVLGAGLDVRAWRLPDLQDVHVFEVDHPATQREKRKRVADLRSPGEVAFVQVDFTRDPLAERLRSAGFASDRPTFWIWEGVVPYLPREAVATTLRAVRGLSAPESRLAITYIEPDPTQQGSLGTTRRFVAGLGEPFVGLVTREDLTASLHEAGWQPLEDTDPADWSARYSARPPDLTRLLRERLVVAGPVPA